MPVLIHPESAAWASVGLFVASLVVDLVRRQLSNTIIADNKAMSASVRYGKKDGAMAESDRPKSNLGAATNIGIANIAAAAASPLMPAKIISFC